jgi:hypothetical protein
MVEAAVGIFDDGGGEEGSRFEGFEERTGIGRPTELTTFHTFSDGFTRVRTAGLVSTSIHRRGVETREF